MRTSVLCAPADRAPVDATVEGDHTIQAKTSNVSAVIFELGTGAGILRRATKVTVVPEGQTLRKRHDLQGLIDDGGRAGIKPLAKTPGAHRCAATRQ